jgi:hypothetical protein
MESVYTPEAVAGKFAPIAPLFFAGAGLLIAGLVLCVKDENDGKPVKDPELDRDLLETRVIDGRSYLLIPIDGELEVNGQPVVAR